MKQLYPALLALAVTQVLSSVQADTLDPVTIEDTVTINPNASEPEYYNRSRGVSADGGDFLGQISGVSTSRLGGRGLEPVVRGQSQTRVNILLDGAYVHGGCPNRMDPPASWAALETYEKVTVLKGVQSLLYGGGGSGGTVLFERDSRSLAEEKGMQGRVGLSASDNNTPGDLSVDVMSADDKGYIRGIGEIKTVENYEDGDGREVRSSYDHQQAGIILGLTPNDDRLFELSFERNDFEDALYPGAGMDSPEETGKIFRLRYEDKPAAAWLDSVETELYLSDVDHLMNNFSLRTSPKYPQSHPDKAGKDMKRETPTTSKTTGGRFILESSSGNTQWNYGVDLQRNERDAVLNNMESGVAKSLSLMWPEATIEQTGIFAEATAMLAKGQRLKYGLRVDFVDSSADKANDKPSAGPKTPNEIYNIYYGVSAEDKDETNLGGLLRYEQDLNNGLTLFTGLSRSVRPADATERYMNKWTPKGQEKQRWVGNPDIESEQHHQIDVGLSREEGEFRWSSVLFYDDVSDYILRDTARGQVAIKQNDGAEIYRNVDAELMGAELEGQWSLNTALDFSASLAYVYADNTSENRPIAQTPPVNGKLQLDYELEKWGFGSRVRYAGNQDRIDTFSKQEVGKTPGYGVLDLYGNYNINDTFSLRLGVDNVTDKTYAEHINRENLLEVEAVRVNEPGRAIWAKISADF
jgi:iron complex outermembrane receptor protein